MKNKNKNEIFKNIALITQLGLSMITPILLGVFIGGKIDKLVGTKGGFMITFILLGAGAGFMNLIKIAKKGGKK